MNTMDKEIYWAAVRADFKVFLQHAFRTLYPGKGFIDNWHIDAIVYCLEQSIRGNMPRLVINMPPRHLKSFIVSIALPAFILGQDESAKIICVSYSDELAKSLSRDFKRIIESEWYRQIFPNVRPTKLTENELVTDAGGGRYATSVGGTLTGRGGDFILIDDPIKPEDAYSDKIRDSVNDWYKSTLLSRLDDKEKSVLILVMQRLHVNDLTGFAEACGGFHKLSLPAIALKAESIPIGESKNYYRQAGEALHEEREGLAILENIRNQVGEYNFTAQYQQRPEAPEGGLFKRKWFNPVDNAPPLTTEGYLCVSIDSALSTSETADYSAITLIYSLPTGHYVLHAERGRWDYETLRDKILAYVKRYGKQVVFIVERAGSGISLILALRKAGLNCFDHIPNQEKLVRAAIVLPVFAAGRVFIVNKEGHNDWVEPFINEFTLFPNGKFDDQVDSLVQAIRWAERRVNPFNNYFENT